MTELPKHFEITLPLLKSISDDKKIYNINDIIEKLAKDFNLQEEDLKIRSRSGSLIFKHNVWFASTSLIKAGWLERPKPGMIKITDEGKKILSNNPNIKIINYRFMVENSKSFALFREQVREKQKNKKQITEDEEETNQDQTPEEALNNIHSKIDTELELDLLNKVRKLHPAAFEHLVIKLIAQMGYAAGNESEIHLGGSGDQGLDGVINQDVLGLDRVYLQAKRYKEGSGISRSPIDEFSGSLSRKGAGKGIFITTSHFTPDAIRAAEHSQQQVILIDGDELARLMRAYNVGCEIVKGYEVKKLDEGFFDEI